MILKLKERGVPYIELGPFEKNEYTFINGKLFYNNTYIDIELISSVFIHGDLNFSPTNLSETYLDTYNSYMIKQAQLENLRIWLKILAVRDVTVINPPTDTSKYYQLFRLIEAEVPIPKTCITNSATDLQRFVSEIGQVVFKPLTGGYYCREVNHSVLDFLKNQQAEPVIFQEYIKGLDIRVYLLKGKVISAHILEKNDNYLDYRQNPSFSTNDYQYTPIELPDYVVKFCVKAANILGLYFTGIDLKIDEKGQYYLIECNSKPIYMDAEMKLKVPITDKIIDALEKTTSPYIALQKPTLHLNHIKNKYESNLFNYREILELDYQRKQLKKPEVIVSLNEKQIEEITRVKGYENSKYMILEVDDNELKVSGLI